MSITNAGLVLQGPQSHADDLLISTRTAPMVSIEGGSGHLRNCLLQQLDAGGNGVNIDDSSPDSVVKDNVILECTGHGIYVDGGGGGTLRLQIHNNIIYDCGDGDDGIHIANPSSGVDTGHIVMGNTIYGENRTPRDGVRIAGANVQKALVCGNQAIGHSGNKLTDNGTDTDTCGSGSSGGLTLTTKGDLHAFDTGDVRLPVGSNGEFLSANSAESTGLEWVAAPSGTIPDGTDVHHALFWDEDTSGAWEAQPFLVNAVVYGADPTGQTDSTAAIQAAIDAVTSTSANRVGGGVVFFPQGIYRLDTTITVPWGVTLRSFSTDGMPASGNSATSMPATFRANQMNVMFASNQAITMVELYHADSPTTQDWRGASIIGIGFIDYSASHDTVVTGIRVRNMNRVILQDVSFVAFRNTSGRCIYFNPDGGAGDAGQYCHLFRVYTDNVHKAVEYSGEVPDVTMIDCIFYGPGGNPASGSIGLEVLGSSLTTWGCAVQFFDTLIKIDASGSGASGKANRFYGTKLEWQAADTVDNSTAAIWIVDSDADFNLFDGADVANAEGATDCARIDAGSNAIFQNCRIVGTGRQDVITTDSGTNTQQYGHKDKPVHTTTGSLTVDGRHQKIRNTDGSSSGIITLPDSADRTLVDIIIFNSTGGSSATIVPASGDEINQLGVDTAFTMSANTVYRCSSDGTKWWVT